MIICKPVSVLYLREVAWSSPDVSLLAGNIICPGSQAYLPFSDAYLTGLAWLGKIADKPFGVCIAK